MTIECFKCNSQLELEASQKIGRSEQCSSCYASIRCCSMCSFFSLSSYNDCREPTADRIVDKEKPNFCDHYKIGTEQGAQDNSQKNIAAAQALFK